MTTNVTELHNQVDENEASRRRRAIFKALQPYMPQAEVIEALWMWEWDYAEGSAFELADYLHAVCQTTELRQKQGEIRRSLIRNMSRPLVELGPDPWPLMRDYANAMKVSGQSDSGAIPGGISTELFQASESPPGTSILVFVVTHILDAMLNENPVYCARVRSWVAGKLAAAVPAALAGAFSDWLLNQTQPPTHKMDTASMRRIVNLVYVCGCEYFGPTRIDRMLHQAIVAAESQPEARQFAPKELL
jgi:hypothetical protein